MEENRTIIIVDDEAETVKGYVDFLSPKESAAVRRSSRQPVSSSEKIPGPGPSAAEKYQLLLAHSGEEAVAIVQSELKADRRIAAGFFDVKLEGGMDGLATIQAIKALDRDIHCVVVTAYQDRTVEEIHRIFGEEFKDQWDYLNKPFTQGEIVQKARQMTAAWNRKRQLEEMNRQLLQAERMAAVGQVARGIGHEFGNILLRIMGKTDLALATQDPAKIHDHLQVVMKAAERAAVIVRNLQSFSRNEPKFQQDDLAAALEEAHSLVNHELVKASVTWESQVRPAPKARLDRGALAQVFLNLVINAIHAMPKGGKITATIEERRGTDGSQGVAARIADTGTGIPADVLPRIFDFAFTTKGDRGSGIGLSVSRQIVEAHGGTLTVATEVGRGTEFTLWLPVRKP
ncbi:MAG: ATP-binding protein [Oligoflexia bacterium]|nr:ATP-binding protein [Oligoflexia bacterium]